MCTICAEFRPYSSDCDYASVAQSTATGGIESSGASLPVFTLDQIADQLTDGYWGSVSFKYDVSPGDTLTVDITGLTAEGQQLARWALEAWTAVSGLQFSEVNSNAAITFDDNNSGAYANFSYSSQQIDGSYKLLSSNVNVSTGWLASYGTTIDSYSFQTYIHETGHALGLGHAGNYNGSAGYSQTGSGDNHYLNDSWQATVMSYFDQQENTYIGASQALTMTLMAADVLAIQNQYGSADTNTGSTIYGAGSNVGGYLGTLFAQMFGEAAAESTVYAGNDIALTITDTGGVDTLDLSPATADQVIDINSEAVSDILGLTGNLVIARNTVIENVTSGSGNDDINGNGARNKVFGGDGNDTIDGGAGNDILQGDAGADELIGGNGIDWARYHKSNAAVVVNLGANTASGGHASGDTFSGIERVLGSKYDDAITGDGAANYLAGNEGNDTLAGGAGNDILQGDAGADELIGGNGIDWARYHKSNAAVVVDLGANTASGGHASGDTFSGIERVLGSKYDDAITGDGAANYLAGNEGNDTLAGGAGNDILQGDAGADELIGGNGIDWARYHKSNAAVVVDLGANTASGGHASGDTFSGIERVLGSKYDDAITGDGAANYLAGNEGNDTLAGGAGNDILQGDAGADELIGGNGIDWARYHKSNAAVVVDLGANTASGGHASGDTFSGIERVLGSKYDDAITGDGAANYLVGNAGDDTLSGGAGNDQLRGDAGADLFHFVAGGGDDTIIDFEDGSDIIEIAGVTFGQLTIQSVVSDTEVDYGLGTITLTGVDSSLISADDFAFV